MNNDLLKLILDTFLQKFYPKMNRLRNVDDDLIFDFDEFHTNLE